MAAMRAAALAQVAELVEKDTGKVTHSWAQQVRARDIPPGAGRLRRKSRGLSLPGWSAPSKAQGD